MLPVPFYQQRDQFCGPAALSSVFAYYGRNIPQEEIAREVYMPELKGALITDLENYARRQGFKTELFRGDIQKVKSYLRRGIPVILLVDLGFLWVSVPHYVVVIGYDEKCVYLHTGYEEKVCWSPDKLNALWKKMGNVGLVIFP
ncbi:peptidase C39 family protein [Thermocrinis albus]|uniref:peptidase C39 family protein n=1 Tax=Thermocrinis albus TaxID=136094 RepID=UPI001FDF76C3|nr:peptidase C39 family protein [Thermocrinis albus]